MDEFNIEQRVVKIANAVSKAGGVMPIVFLDSSAILDIEEDVRKARLNDSHANSDNFYKPFALVHPNTFVTDEILTEIGNHYKNHLLNGRREISRETSISAYNMRANFVNYHKLAIHRDDF